MDRAPARRCAASLVACRGLRPKRVAQVEVPPPPEPPAAPPRPNRPPNPAPPTKETQPVGGAGRMLMVVAVMAPVSLAGPNAVTHWPTTSAAELADMLSVKVVEVV